MKPIKFLILSALFTTMIGCASTEVIKYPTLTTQNTLSISDQQISAWNESGSGDHFIENSQVLVGDASNASNSTASSAFGLIGLGIATAIDKTKNSNAIEKSALNTPIKFDRLVKSKFESDIKSGALTVTLLNTNQFADFRITPFSRLSFKEKPNVTVTYGYFVKFMNTTTKKEVKKTYMYIAKDKLPLANWDANNNQLFLNKADQAFTVLTHVFSLDVNDQIDTSKTSAAQQEKCKNDLIPTAIFLETAEDLCIGILSFGKKVAPNNIVIVEN